MRRLFRPGSDFRLELSGFSDATRRRQVGPDSGIFVARPRPRGFDARAPASPTRRPAIVSDQARRSKRLALKFALVQLACAGIAALACLGLDGLNAARSAVAGGLIVATGTLVFAWKAFASGWPPVSAARGFYIGELLKWVWVIGAFWLALTRGGFDPLPLLVGLVVAQMGFWVAIGIFKS
jgi:F0F1-type ATP synthase assembly protein I